MNIFDVKIFDYSNVITNPSFLCSGNLYKIIEIGNTSSWGDKWKIGTILKYDESCLNPIINVDSGLGVDRQIFIGSGIKVVLL